ncbi:Sir2 family NAD-dependent protein deacetylase [uncultured Clostridium sp.]|uniref:SIR2 family NAD-dependent protein deacylase n=1 Tax=uncultured Clostridium sp. TaxID=59620 RepID=UPI0025E2BA59|nr:Sir2 family NAD-dependent protein deacetylase [uncultured Clostridium sp.]
MKITNLFNINKNDNKTYIAEENYDDKILKTAECINKADAIVIGAGAGMSTSAGLTYGGERFEKLFPEYIKKYGMKDMYSAGFYPFDTQEEKWAYWSRHIYYNRYDVNAGKPYVDLLNMVRDKNYFVITTNVDSQFVIAGVPKEKIFAVQGDYGYFQCANACHKKLYYNESIIRKMIKMQNDCKIPTELVPKCPVCGGEMEVNLRCDEYFVEDEKWDIAYSRYQNFLNLNRNKNIVFIELGTGMNTPGIIKYPFWKMTKNFSNANYVCINLNEAFAPDEIKESSICIDGDIAEVLDDIKKEVK